jgi:hypothetical protein
MLLIAFGCDPAQYCVPEQTGIDLLSLHISARRLVLATAIVTTLSLLPLCVFGIREISLDEQGAVHTFTPIGSGTMLSVRQTLADIEYYRLVVFTLLLTVVKMNFRHLDALFPKFIERAFNSSSWGFMYSINPLMVILLVPVMTRYTKQYDSFKMIIYGSLIVGIAPAFLIYTTIITAILFVV